ncbi:MAG: GNAT family N-acetyltransferase [Alphaproteobacteria bacterium]|nr:GNAT family N-acetyltransferase [Alphaproteobacteria bacterium]
MTRPDLTIRAAEPADYAAYQAMLSDADGFGGTLQLPFPSAELWRKRLAERDEDSHNLVGCAPDGTVVGSISLHTQALRWRRRHAAHLGMSVRRDWRRQGVGSTLMAAALDLADNWLGLTRIELTVYCDNSAAIALYRKFGFAVEGTMRAFALRNGCFVDAYAMARLRASAPSPSS